MLTGLAVALYSLLYDGPGGLPDSAVARVNERYISQEDYARALAAVVADSSQALTAAQRRRVLERLIDEELLLQYGLQQGLAQSDRRVRANLISAVIDAKSVAAETRPITVEQARAFYEQNRAYFSRPHLLRVRVVRVSNEAAATTLRESWLSGELPSGTGLRVLDHVPDALQPPGKLRQLIGSTLTATAEQMREGDISQPVPIGDNWHLLKLLQRVESVPAFDAVMEQVKSEMRRRAAETAVAEALLRMREEQSVVIAQDRL